MATRQPARTPPRIIWGLIDAEMSAQRLDQRQLAKLVGVHYNTVYSDAREPEKIPLSRLFVYFAALGIDPTLMLRPIAHSIAERMIE